MARFIIGSMFVSISAPWCHLIWSSWCGPCQKPILNKQTKFQYETLLTSPNPPSSSSINFSSFSNPPSIKIFYACLFHSKMIWINITYYICQLVCLIGNIKTFVRVNNRSVTWNISMNWVHNFLKRLLQILINNRILHDATWDASQRVWIKQMLLILSYIDTEIVTYRSSPFSPLLLFPNVIHMIK